MQLRRITTSGSWIPEIDGLRFVAIMYVLFSHIYGQLINNRAHVVLVQNRYHTLTGILNNGQRGVLLFFAISGYILAKPFVRSYIRGGKPFSLSAYYLRRLTRLEPPYILSLLIYFVAFVLLMHDSVRADLRSLLLNVFYVHNFSHGIKSLNFVAWSLEVEVQFYLLAPLIGRIYLLQSAILRRTIWISLLVASMFAAHHLPDPWNWNLPGCLAYFMVGFLLADIEAVDGTNRPDSKWDVVGFIVWPAFFLIPSFGPISVLLPLIIFLAFRATLVGPISKAILSAPFIAVIGGMCYSIYLMHMLLVSLIGRIAIRFTYFHDFLINYLVHLIICLPFVLALSTVYFVLIERPCMDPKWPSKLLAKIQVLYRPAVFPQRIEDE